MAAPNLHPIPESVAAASLSAAHNNLLRFTTAGSVDDGKSTLIGRLLYDSQAVYEDQLASVKKSKVNRANGPIDFSLLTDGLRAEREQGITIDVAYRYFTTPRRKFIIADTPGHEQYTRNMATGASTADAAIVLIDATKGVLPQSRRHAYIASLLGIRHVVAAINKMDLAAYSQEVFDRISREFGELAEKLTLQSVYPVPISALEGDNVVRHSTRMPWFTGPALLEYLEELETARDAWEETPTRFPVQHVIRPDANFRGFAGTVASGVLRTGGAVTVLPSGASASIKSIVTFDGDLEEARSGQSVTVTLDREVDVSRGDMIVADSSPACSRNFEATLVWMHATPLDPDKLYILKHTTRTVRARIRPPGQRFDVNTLNLIPADTLEMNDIAQVQVETTLPLFFDPYRAIRLTGSFILIDALSNATAAAGMIEGVSNLVPVQQKSSKAVSAEERRERFDHPAGAAWFTNVGAAQKVERALFDAGWNVALIDVAALKAPELVAVANALRAAGAFVIYSSPSRDHVARNAIIQGVGESSFFEDDGTVTRDAAEQIAARAQEWAERALLSQRRGQ
jgi:sulfate adenylyltransferase large subunit